VIGPLRTILRIDSAACLALGAAALIFAGRLADAIGVDSSLAVRVVGVVLVVYAIALAELSRSTPRLVAMTGRVTAATDAAWVAASVALMAADVFSDRGDVAVGALAIAVAAIGVGKLLGVRAFAGQAAPGHLATAT
jgi:hypothetical protein